MTLINAVPDLVHVANPAGIQIANVDSSDITSEILLNLSKQINKYVCEDPTMDGAVVTHGTDVLEETAFFLDATVNCGKPVVIVGSMRPATALSADGPFNRTFPKSLLVSPTPETFVGLQLLTLRCRVVLQAVTTAVWPGSRDRGALVVLNDRITSAYYVTKTNANTVDTFLAPEMGHLGSLISNTPYYYYPAVKPTGKRSYSVSDITALPRVDILFAYQEMAVDTLYNAVKSGAEGIVIAGSGAGGVSSRFEAAIEDVINNRKIPVVRGSRATNGEVPSSSIASKTAMHIASGYLNPMKSRILLALLLAHGKNIGEIRDAFAPSTNA